MSKIKVARYRTSPYVVNFKTETGIKQYHWAGSKGNRIDIREIPEEVIERLLLESVCFRNGELVIIEDTPEAKEIVESIDELEVYKANAISKEEVIKILNLPIKKFESELKKIENQDTKGYVIEIAEEIGIDSNSKLNFLASWYGVKKELLFN